LSGIQACGLQRISIAKNRLASPQLRESFGRARWKPAVAPRRTLSHPSIVTIYNFDEAGRFFDLLMEFVDGVNLRQAMKAGRSAIIVIIVRQRTGHFESGQKPTVLAS
jgi:serine/threonine protein kinase